MSIERPYYAVLGVDHAASRAQIKSAYRRLVKTMHPDAGGNPDAFVLLNRAYTVLMDPEARKHYDLTGTTGEMDPLTFQKAVLKMLATSFDSALKAFLSQHISIESVDFMNAFKAMCRQGLQNLQKDEERLAIEVKSLYALRGRIKRRDDEKNLFVEVIDAKLNEQGPILDQMTKELKVAKRTVEEIEQYDDLNVFLRTMQASTYSSYGAAGGYSFMEFPIKTA